jgi:hypothetical protein
VRRKSALLAAALAAVVVAAADLDTKGIPASDPAPEWRATERRSVGVAREIKPHPATFEKVVIDPTLGESCAVGDIDGDGRPDIVSGRWWYRNPDWKRFEFRTLGGEIKPDGTGYELCGGDDLLDVDGDGDLDVLSTHLFTGTMIWYENPGRGAVAADRPWVEHLIAKTGFIEFHMLVDIDGDGRRRELLPDNNEVAWYTPGPDPKMPWVRHAVRDKGPGHGIGAGDLNGDGKVDILTRAGWLEAPRSSDRAWRAHSFPFGHRPEEIFALDCNGDGRPDLIASDGHGYGLYWAENLGPDAAGELRFEVHVIDGTWAQLHGLNLVDFDGDGDLDIFVGKRHLAHNGRDPGEDEPCQVVWYEKLVGANWAKHAISVDGTVGNGYRIPVVDLDGDGDLDVVVKSKKSGLVLLRNLTKSPRVRADR